jgi:hypothetical protein
MLVVGGAFIALFPVFRTRSWFFPWSAKAAATWLPGLAPLCPERDHPQKGASNGKSAVA